MQVLACHPLINNPVQHFEEAYGLNHGGLMVTSNILILGIMVTFESSLSKCRLDSGSLSLKDSWRIDL